MTQYFTWAPAQFLLRSKGPESDLYGLCFPFPLLTWAHSSTLESPGKSHGWRSLVGCSPWGRKESDTTEQLHFHFSLSCIREGNGNPLQCSCLENPMDSGAWWAAVYGVTQSRTPLKRFSSSSSRIFPSINCGKVNSTKHKENSQWDSRYYDYVLLILVFLVFNILQ